MLPRTRYLCAVMRMPLVISLIYLYVLSTEY